MVETEANALPFAFGADTLGDAVVAIVGGAVAVADEDGDVMEPVVVLRRLCAESDISGVMWHRAVMEFCDVTLDIFRATKRFEAASLCFAWRAAETWFSQSRVAMKAVATCESVLADKVYEKPMRAAALKTWLALNGDGNVKQLLKLANDVEIDVYPAIAYSFSMRAPRELGDVTDAMLRRASDDQGASRQVASALAMLAPIIARALTIRERAQLLAKLRTHLDSGDIATLARVLAVDVDLKAQVSKGPPDSIRLHVGKRLRRRRRLLGLTQQQLGESVGRRFQVIQRWETGGARLDSSEIFLLAEALNVPVNYFYEGLRTSQSVSTGFAANDRDLIAADVLSQKETLELIRAYYALPEGERAQIRQIAQSLRSKKGDVA